MTNNKTSLERFLSGLLSFTNRKTDICGEKESRVHDVYTIKAIYLLKIDASVWMSQKFSQFLGTLWDIGTDSSSLHIFPVKIL
ncbi:hypothetical protein [Bacillus salacetis]|uniref:hypothetical protein n=1 Tax=Bacillus salacetis TaxID=2315464 RepID=UPI001443F0DE|nr:hypothetical protein [Bacillus salacetis]